MAFKSIEEKGGLKVHIQGEGYSYSWFEILARVDAPATVIAAVLSLDKKDKLARSTASHWKKIYKQKVDV